MRKPAFCICENKDADQLRGNREADQRLRFRYMDSTIPLLPKSEISSFYPSSVTAQPGLCRTWSETPKTGFLTTRLKLCFHSSCVCDIDPFTAAVSEMALINRRDYTSTSLIGELVNYVMSDTFGRLRCGDRFWYEFDAAGFTQGIF